MRLLYENKRFIDALAVKSPWHSYRVSRKLTATVIIVVERGWYLYPFGKVKSRFVYHERIVEGY
jgi:hypothetical protein